MDKKKTREAYSAFNKLLCPILAINDKYDVIFLNKTAEEAYKTNIRGINEVSADALSAGGTAGKCYKISHGYDKPCFQLGENCPLRELISNKDKNTAAVNHDHKGQIYKVEAYRDGEDGSLFLESHVNISEFISEIDIIKKAKENIELSEKRLKTFFDNLPVPSLIIDVESGLIIDADKKAVDFYGWSKEELRNMTMADINPFVSIKETIDFRAKALKEGYNFAVFRHKLKSGSVRDVEANISGFVYNDKTYIQAVMNDVTEKKVLEERLRESEELLRTLIDNLPISIGMHKEKYIYVSPEFRKMFGYTEEELKNIDAWEVDAEEYREAAKSRVEHGLTDINDTYDVIVQGVKKSGERLWMHIHANSIRYKGEVVRIASFIDITDQISREQNILVEKDIYKELSEIDALTQIYNRRAMDAKLTELLNLAKRYNRPLSLIMFDIDKFKNINDTFGHETGDLILKELAAAAKENLRTTDFFARYGGEEFMVITHETPLKTAKELAERLRLKVQGHDFKIGKNVTISLGVASLAVGDDEHSIIHRVDSALYKAKESGRNLVCSENFNGKNN
jgi:diguanylate cyclase (GGDEF)-like protein/PAS domain S-box-containing protein